MLGAVSQKRQAVSQEVVAGKRGTLKDAFTHWWDRCTKPGMRKVYEERAKLLRMEDDERTAPQERKTKMRKERRVRETDKPTGKSRARQISNVRKRARQMKRVTGGKGGEGQRVKIKRIDG